MRWYVLQTKTGEEEKLIKMIRRMVPEDLYGECFAVYHEQLWRRQQKNFVHVKRVFPGYVFITSKEPEALFFCLKKLPAMTKMMADDEFFFLSLDPEEAAFLETIMDKQHVIGLSYLETDGRGNIIQVSGPLTSCRSRIVYCKFGKRYAIVRLRLLGREKDVLLGIILKEDICQEVRYGKVEMPVSVPRQYRIERDEAPEDFSVGNKVVVTDGIFNGMTGMVYQVKDKAVRIGIQLFGRMVEMEIPSEILKKVSRG